MTPSATSSRGLDDVSTVLVDGEGLVLGLGTVFARVTVVKVRFVLLLASPFRGSRVVWVVELIRSGTNVEDISVAGDVVVGAEERVVRIVEELNQGEV